MSAADRLRERLRAQARDFLGIDSPGPGGFTPDAISAPPKKGFQPQAAAATAPVAVGQSSSGSSEPQTEQLRGFFRWQASHVGIGTIYPVFPGDQDGTNQTAAVDCPQMAKKVTFKDWVVRARSTAVPGGVGHTITVLKNGSSTGYSINYQDAAYGDTITATGTPPTFEVGDTISFACWSGASYGSGNLCTWRAILQDVTE